MFPDLESANSTVALLILGFMHVAMLTYVLGGIRVLLSEHTRRLDRHDRRIEELEDKQ